MNEKTSARNVTLKDLWELFIHRLWVLILAAAVAAGGLFLVSWLTFVPSYSSTATLYILRQDNDTSGANSVSDFSLALNVVNDCDFLLKSHSVLDEVIRELDVDISYKELSRSVTTSNPENTRILEVTVEAGSPQQAKQIVDTICEIGQEKIAEAMGFQQVNLYEYGTLDTSPCNRMGPVVYMLVGLAAAVLVYAVFLVIFLLDDRIRTEEDIERYLGLSVLGDIPNADEKKKHHYGYYSAYGSGNGKKAGKKRR